MGENNQGTGENKRKEMAFYYITNTGISFIQLRLYTQDSTKSR